MKKETNIELIKMSPKPLHDNTNQTILEFLRSTQSTMVQIVKRRESISYSDEEDTVNDFMTAIEEATRPKPNSSKHHCIIL